MSFVTEQITANIATATIVPPNNARKMMVSAATAGPSVFLVGPSTFILIPTADRPPLELSVRPYTSLRFFAGSAITCYVLWEID